MIRLRTGVARAVALSLCCALAAPAWAQQSAPAQQSPVSPDPASVVVAIVDGEEITLAELLNVKESLPEQYRLAPLEMLYVNLLDQVVERRILARAALAKGLDEDAEVKLRLARAREAVLLEAYITGEIGPKLTEEKVRERYQKNQIASGGGDDEVHALHILVESEADASSIRRELDAGADFREMAKKHSKGPSAPRGGDLGFFGRKDMVPEFSEAAFALEPGEVSAPVKTQFGWHVILVVERRTAPPPAFEEVAEQLRKDVAREAVTDLVADLRSKAQVQLFNPDGSPIVMPNVVQPAK